MYLKHGLAILDTNTNNNDSYLLINVKLRTGTVN